MKVRITGSTAGQHYARYKNFVGTVVEQTSKFVTVEFENVRDLQYIYFKDLEPVARLLESHTENQDTLKKQGE